MESQRRAQELCHKAFDTWKTDERERLAKDALALWPDCADAHAILARDAEDPQEAKRLYEEAVAAGERALRMDDDVCPTGSLRGRLDARPYLRARSGLASQLWLLGGREAAIEHALRTLALDERDEERLRHRLVNWLLEERRVDEAQVLLRRYPAERSTAWAYSRLLADLAKRLPTVPPPAPPSPGISAEGAERDRILDEAFAANPYVPAQLLGDVLPSAAYADEDAEAGDGYEAEAYEKLALEAWRATPRALEWLDTAATLLDPRGPASLSSWREPASEYPALARYKDALEALLEDKAAEHNLAAGRRRVPEGYHYFVVVGRADRMARMAEELLEDGVSDFSVSVRTAQAAEPFELIGVTPGVTDEGPLIPGDR